MLEVGAKEYNYAALQALPPKAEPPRAKRPHVLLTPETCDCGRTSDGKCPVCDWGLGVCAVCGGAESELTGTECPGEKRKAVPYWNPCPMCDGMGRKRDNTKCPRCKGTGQYPSLDRG